MNISAPFIKRPVATTLLTAAVALSGILAFRLLPVAPLPEVEFPTIQVHANLPGASPETMASAVATPLERQFGRIAGVTEMTSSSQLSSTGITLQFDLSRNIDAAGRDVDPGSGVAGMLYVGGIQPLGYYKDAKKTAETFRILDGTRYVVSGDYATLEADGTITFLGRGNVSINSGGEKVYPDEVERVLMQHPAVAEAAVIGMPDPLLGEIVCSLVHRQQPATADELIAFVKSRLASYKAPKRINFVAVVPRHPYVQVEYPAVPPGAICHPHGLLRYVLAVSLLLQHVARTDPLERTCVCVACANQLPPYLGCLSLRVVAPSAIEILRPSTD